MRLANERGAVILIAPSLIIAVLFFAGFAFDCGRLFLAKQRGQLATDAGALSGAKYVLERGFQAVAPEDIEERSKAIVLENLRLRTQEYDGAEADAIYDVVNGTIQASVNIPVDYLLINSIPGTSFLPANIETSSTVRILPAKVALAIDASASMTTPSAGGLPKRVYVLNAAQQFVDRFDGTRDYLGIYDFNIRARELAAPVMPNGSFDYPLIHDNYLNAASALSVGASSLTNVCHALSFTRDRFSQLGLMDPQVTPASVVAFMDGSPNVFFGDFADTAAALEINPAASAAHYYGYYQMWIADGAGNANPTVSPLLYPSVIPFNQPGDQYVGMMGGHGRAACTCFNPPGCAPPINAAESVQMFSGCLNSLAFRVNTTTYATALPINFPNYYILPYACAIAQADAIRQANARLYTIGEGPPLTGPPPYGDLTQPSTWDQQNSYLLRRISKDMRRLPADPDFTFAGNPTNASLDQSNRGFYESASNVNQLQDAFVALALAIQLRLIQ